MTACTITLTPSTYPHDAPCCCFPLQHLFNDSHTHLMEAVDEANEEVAVLTENEQIPRMEVNKGTPFTRFTL
jgi:hypothetical protein